jgi:Ricin-type beta-trefoil lectin domain.
VTVPAPSPEVLRPPIRTRQPINENTVVITSYYSPPFELRCKAVNSHCLTAGENSLVLINPCETNISSQQWAFEIEYGYLQNVGSGRCLIPNFSDNSSVKVRLVVGPCPNREDDFYKWRFSDGFVVKAEATSSEAELVIEAARAIKRLDGHESVVLIPVLSNVDDSKIDFQMWDREFVV